MFDQWRAKCLVFLTQLRLRREHRRIHREYKMLSNQTNWVGSTAALLWFCQQVPSWQFRHCERDRVRSIELVSRLKNVDRLLMVVLAVAKAVFDRQPIDNAALTTIQMPRKVRLDDYLVTNLQLPIQPKEAAQVLLDNLLPALREMENIRTGANERDAILHRHYERQTTYLFAEIHGLFEALYELEQLTR